MVARGPAVEGGLRVKIVEADTMALIDARSTSEYGIASATLMERAGREAWRALRDDVPGGSAPGPVVFAGGRGANGGDAFVMARHARRDGRDVSVVLAAGRPSPGTDAAANLAACEGIPCVSWADDPSTAARLLAGSRWVVDGITGTGLRGPLRAPLDALVAAVNAAPGGRAAVDVPSGLGDGYREGWPVVHADATITMGLPKACLYLPRARRHVGRIFVVQPGFPPPLLEDPDILCEQIDEHSFRGLLPPVPVDAYKGDRGHLAVFAGAPGTSGAAWLASHAAARARVGLVSLFLDAPTFPLVAPSCRSVMAKPWDDAGDPSRFDASRHTALLIGPGWGLAEPRARWLAGLLGTDLPGVLDADGITLLAQTARGVRPRLGGRWVLTPHPGEFSRLSGATRDEILDDPVGRALAEAHDLEAVVVLKGHVTVVAGPDGRSRILDGCNPALATAGSGDVLAGLVGAGLSAGLAAFDAAVFGVSLHARLGTVARGRAGWFLAEDLVPLASEVLGEAYP
jgi:ADP-dependent NAD(P)H-hydrate dehydratase / NAD(P)H-hydrate epimerase